MSKPKSTLFTMISRYLILICSLLVSASVLGKDPVRLSQFNNQLNLASSLEYSIDSAPWLSSPPIEGWSEFQYPQIKLGFDDRVHWFRFTVSNDTSLPKDPLLEINSPLIDNLAVYTVIEGEVTSSQILGDQHLFSQRPVQVESYVIPLLLQPAQSFELYIAVNNSGLIQLPIQLWNKEYFQQVKSFQRLKSGLIYGFYFAVILGLIFVYTRTKQSLLLINGGFMLSVLAIALTSSGLAFQYIWPVAPIVQQHSFFVFTCLALFFASYSEKRTLTQFYSEQFIDAPKTLLTLNIIAATALSLIPLSLLLPYSVAISLIIIIAILVSIVHLSVAIKAWRQGLHEHQEINYSLLIMLAGLLLIMANASINWPLTYTNNDILSFCLTLQAIVVLKTLLDEQSTDSTESEQIASNNETELSDRMLELQFTLRELEEKNKQLEKLNTLDALSGINNRAHFDKRLLAEIRRARRELTPLSLIIFDIDHFKKFNDNYGHLLGDQVIRTVAHTAAEQLNRSSDEIFRYGGEEYAVILPNTQADGALKVAELIRQAIAETAIPHNEQTLNCYVSLGVCSHDFQSAITPETLIEQADKALYKAKQNGRNQVQIFSKED